MAVKHRSAGFPPGPLCIMAWSAFTGLPFEDTTHFGGALYRSGDWDLLQVSVNFGANKTKGKERIAHFLIMLPILSRACILQTHNDCESNPAGPVSISGGCICTESADKLGQRKLSKLYWLNKSLYSSTFYFRTFCSRAVLRISAVEINHFKSKQSKH